MLFFFLQITLLYEYINISLIVRSSRLGKNKLFIISDVSTTYTAATIEDINTVTKTYSYINDYLYTRKNAQVVTSLQTSCNKSVHKLLTSCVHTACS